MGHLFELEDARVEGPLGLLYEGLSWRVPERAVTVLLGPAGTGKSALLRGLSGHALPPGWSYAGSWRYRGLELRRGSVPADLCWLPQASRLPLQADEARAPRRWEQAFAGGASTLLLDEPTRGESAASVEALAGRLREQARHGAAVVVTHDLAFARRVADRAGLICAGRLVAEAEASAFFEAPADELARRFLAQGNCWPSASPSVSLPSHFRWVLPGRLAGMGRPGLLGPVEADLEAIALAGVTDLVTLTEEPLPATLLRPFGLRARHFPVRDMGVPALHTTAGLCREIERTMTRGTVALHCHAGLGRTGTLLAAVLVWLGREPDVAVAELRALGRGYVQNRAQEDFVRRFAASVGPAPAGSRT